MPEYQKQVIEEQKQLEEKIDKLSNFTKTPDKWGQVEADEQQRMENQLLVMQLYNKILCDRIRTFPPVTA